MHQENGYEVLYELLKARGLSVVQLTQTKGGKKAGPAPPNDSCVRLIGGGAGNRLSIGYTVFCVCYV